jgi:hypothetical protein
LFTIHRHPIFFGFALALGSLCFALGAWSSQFRIEQQIAESDAQIADAVVTERARRSTLVEDVKRQLESEMGLLPIRALRERRKSFVAVNSYDKSGAMNYSTAGYLGDGYFITVKHGVIALNRGENAREITSITVLYHGKPLPARIVDSGDADIEVHAGDWAILQVSGAIDLPPLKIDTNYAYDFAEPIFRLGNDYSKGILLSTGYVGQRLDGGLVSALTDGHPGVSGGGVLDAKGNLVGIPIGRIEGDYRFSFILPLRPEMFRNVPVLSAGDLTSRISPTAGARLP